MERYLNTLKNKCTNLYEFRTEKELYQTVEEFAYANHVRLHSYNGYRTPYQTRTEACLRIGLLDYPKSGSSDKLRVAIQKIFSHKCYKKA